jgi:drug/metabolite transporter (DMT)-like permease
VLPTPPPDIRQGIACMILGMALFTLNDALGKWLVASYPVALILAIRSLFALPLLAIPVWRAGLRPVFAVTDPGRHLLRLVFVVVEIGFFYWSVRALPLADVMTIYMAAPLFVTALSVPLLGERVGPRRWAALGVGFVGVMLVLGPTGGTLSLHALAALGGSLSFALMLILTRKLRDAGGLSLITSQTLAVGVAGAVALPFHWTVPGPVDFVLIGLLGVVAMGGHLLVNRSVQISPAPAVVPFQYTSLIWAILLGYAVWGDVPTPAAALGAALIVGSGLFVFHREQKASATVQADAQSSSRRSVSSPPVTGSDSRAVLRSTTVTSTPMPGPSGTTSTRSPFTE